MLLLPARQAGRWKPGSGGEAVCDAWPHACGCEFPAAGAHPPPVTLQTCRPGCWMAGLWVAWCSLCSCGSQTDASKTIQTLAAVRAQHSLAARACQVCKGPAALGTQRPRHVDAFPRLPTAVAHGIQVVALGAALAFYCTAIGGVAVKRQGAHRVPDTARRFGFDWRRLLSVRAPRGLLHALTCSLAQRGGVGASIPAASQPCPALAGHRARRDGSLEGGPAPQRD